MRPFQASAAQFMVGQAQCDVFALGSRGVGLHLNWASRPWKGIWILMFLICNLSQRLANGGRLLAFGGWSDPGLFPNDTRRSRQAQVTSNAEEYDVLNQCEACMSYLRDN